MSKIKSSNENLEIEAGGTGHEVEFLSDTIHGDNVKAKFGASDDLQIYFDGYTSFIKDATTDGPLELWSNQMYFRNGAGTKKHISTADGSGVTLFYDGATRLNTTTDGVSIAGDITSTGDIKIYDSSYGKLKIGNSDDLEIYHTATGNHSIIEETGGGNLVVRTNGPHIEFDKGSTEYMARMLVDGAVELYYDSALKLATSSTGIDISGTATMDGLTVDTTADNGAVITADDNATTTYPLKVQNSAGSGRLEIGTYGINNNIDLKLQTQDKTRLEIDGSTGDISFYEDTGTTAKFFWDASAEGLNVGGSTNYNYGINVGDAGYGINSTGVAQIVMRGTEYRLQGVNASPMTFYTSNTERMHINSDGDVGIGTSSPQGPLHVYGSEYAYIGPNVAGVTPDSATGGIAMGWNKSSGQGESIIAFNKGAGATGGLVFADNNGGTYNERMRIDSSGNLLVGTTQTDVGYTDSGAGFSVNPSGFIQSARSSVFPNLYLNKLDNNGSIIEFRKDGITVGSIGSSATGGGSLVIGNASSGIMFRTDLTGSAFIPANPTTGAQVDNTLDIGHSVIRFDDIYATNGTIQTSDRNEKQDIDELSEAEQRVAVACKGLMRKFRWKDAVEEKGDDARIHFGIMAQDLQATFEAEGLDAGKYAMFISTTWWEAERIIPAVEAVEAQDAVYEEVIIPAVLDEDGNEVEPERTEQTLISEAVEAIEAVEEHTVTDTFDTLEEAPEGAIERTRMGVRYTELLAFIIGAI